MVKTLKSYWLATKEWGEAVPQKWWGMLGTVLSLMSMVGAIIAFYIWGRNIEPPMPFWIAPSLGIGLLIFIILNIRAYNHVRLERDKAKLLSMSNNRSKTETLLEMRTSRFYDVTKTLDQMREQTDTLSESNTREIDSKILPSLFKDVVEILGVNTPVNKIMETRVFNAQRFKAINTASSRKWGDMKNPNDPKTIEFVREVSGIYRLHKVDVFTLCRRDKGFRQLGKLLSEQRRLVLCDGTYKTIERYLFYLEGYGNIFMNMLFVAGCVNIDTILTPEQKTQFADFKRVKNIVLTNLLKDVTLSIDAFIKESISN